MDEDGSRVNSKASHKTAKVPTSASSRTTLSHVDINSSLPARNAEHFVKMNRTSQAVKSFSESSLTETDDYLLPYSTGVKNKSPQENEEIVSITRQSVSPLSTCTSQTPLSLSKSRRDSSNVLDSATPITDENGTDWKNHFLSPDNFSTTALAVKSSAEAIGKNQKAGSSHDDGFISDTDADSCTPTAHTKAESLGGNVDNTTTQLNDADNLLDATPDFSQKTTQNRETNDSEENDSNNQSTENLDLQSFDEEKETENTSTCDDSSFDWRDEISPMVKAKYKSKRRSSFLLPRRAPRFSDSPVTSISESSANSPVPTLTPKRGSGTSSNDDELLSGRGETSCHAVTSSPTLLAPKIGISPTRSRLVDMPSSHYNLGPISEDLSDAPENQMQMLKLKCTRLDMENERLRARLASKSKKCYDDQILPFRTVFEEVRIKSECLFNFFLNETNHKLPGIVAL